mmetsp:Transcript_55947/g.97656  ORF Transcript_55947/g.97656 Transcript_55947/m.97656 type:complete len:83 (+) Transcript_55947:3-251(+)
MGGMGGMGMKAMGQGTGGYGGHGVDGSFAGGGFGGGYRKPYGRAFYEPWMESEELETYGATGSGYSKTEPGKFMRRRKTYLS